MPSARTRPARGGAASNMSGIVHFDSDRASGDDRRVRHVPVCRDPVRGAPGQPDRDVEAKRLVVADRGDDTGLRTTA
jgi:hypothetical protein